MDFHILIVISCVFLASLFSLLFINKFFRRKTFEEIIAEKKAMTDKIYGQTKAAKKPRKVQQQKKELKREKKLRQKDSQKDTEVDDSDGHSENHSVEDGSPGPNTQKPATRVEFAEPELVTDSDNGQTGPSPVAETNNQEKQQQQQQQPQQQQLSAKGGNSKSSKKRGGGGGDNHGKAASTGKSGILVNKNEPVAEAKETVAIVEDQAGNHFDIKNAKDTIELKRQDKQQHQPQSKKSIKKNSAAALSVADSNGIEVLTVAKELKQLDEKATRQGSPKNQNNKIKHQHKKNNEKEFVALDKLGETDTIGVSLLMNLFGRAELNRSEIQILIDYLLNKQQDMPTSHSEWSDDIVQKLKRQLEEKEKALQDEQEASVGIQAKLRDLRLEVNSERAQMNATIKAYIEEIHGKKQEIVALNQEMQMLNDKFSLERQQFQTKLRLEKQAGSQDLLVQLQRENERSNMMQNELVHKDKCITELTCIVNASHQAVEESKQKSNEIIQTQGNQIRALEQKLDESEVIINEQRYALEQSKNVENELDACKVELRNLQNALDSTQAELVIARNEMDLTKAELIMLRNELNEKQKHIDEISANNNELSQQIGGISSRCEEQDKEQFELQNNLQILREVAVEKDQKIAEYEASFSKLASKEGELLQQIQEQKEKNNLQQQQLLLAVSTKSAPLDPSKDQKHIRELFQRLYPDAVKANADSALSLSFDQWVEQVLAVHVKQSLSKSCSNKSTTTTNSSEESSSNNHNSSPHNHNNLNNSEEINKSKNNSNSNNSVNDSSSSNSSDQAETQNLRKQNAQLRVSIDELTKLVTKTGNTLSELETRAREQDEHWRSIVRSKEDEIYLLKHSNGEQDV